MKKQSFFHNGIVTLLLLSLLAGCASAAEGDATTPAPAMPETTSLENTVEPTNSVTTASETQQPATQVPGEEDEPRTWLDLPIVPEVSPAMIEVFERGLADGRDPNRFSKIGDCQNITTYFLAMFDGGTYRLGDEYAYLQSTIDHFAGSWSRKSMAVKGGLNVAAAQNPMWTQAVEDYTKQDLCKDGETPLVCELRDHNPSFVIISMEESWAGSYEIYDSSLRQIVDYVLSLNIVPILATRTESLSQDRQINDIIVKVAEDYDLPLWNFGAAVADLPDAGFRENDKFHLTEGKSFFDDPEMMTKGWPWRNLTALQALDAVSRAVGAQ